jgi:hypothetical protein
MTAYELMIKTNHYLIQNPSENSLSAAQKRRIVRELLAARSTPEQRERFYAGVRFPGNRDAHGMRLYPDFYIPPYNDGKKYKTILGQTPKTHILSANMYELEILRLLYKFAPDDRDVRAMTEATLERLYHTCFGNQDDGVGECFDTNLVVIRYLCTTSPQDLIRIKSRMSVYRRHRGKKPRSWHTDWYYRLCLSEATYALCEAEVKNTLPDVQSFFNGDVPAARASPELRPVLQAIAGNLETRLREYL